MKLKIAFLFLFFGAVGLAESPCSDFKGVIDSDSIKPHKGVCLVKDDFARKNPDVIRDQLAVFYPLIEDGKMCDSKKKKTFCKVLITTSWNNSASLGVVVSATAFKESNFNTDDLEETLTYFRENLRTNFRRKI